MIKKKLQSFFFCVKRQAKNYFLKDVESTIVYSQVNKKKIGRDPIADMLNLPNFLWDSLIYGSKHPVLRTGLLSFFFWNFIFLLNI